MWDQANCPTAGLNDQRNRDAEGNKWYEAPVKTLSGYKGNFFLLTSH